MILRIVALIAVLFFQSFPVSAQEQDTWVILLQRDHEELQYQSGYVDGVTRTIPGMVHQTRQELAVLQKKLEELRLLGKKSGSSPTELRAVLAGLNILEARLREVSDPFRKAGDDLGGFDRRIEELEKDYARQGSADVSPEGAKLQDTVQADIRKLKGKLSRARAVLEQGIGPCNDLGKDIATFAQSVTGRIPTAWKGYYLNQGKGFLSVSVWQEAMQRLRDLPRTLATYVALFDSGGGSTVDVLTRLAGFVLAFLLGGIVLMREFRKLYPALHMGRAMGALTWIGLGSAFTWATSGPAFVLVRAEAGAVSEVLLARGILVLSWLLHEAECGVGETRRNPARTAWRMFALAVLFKLPWLPEAMRGALWVAALLVAGWIIRRARPIGESGAVLRLARLGGYLYPALAVPALLGWVNLTLLTAMAWFLLLVFLQLGLALYSLGSRLVEGKPRSLVEEMVRTVARHLVQPVTVIAMGGAFLWWLSLAMGGSSVFLDLVSSDVKEGGLSVDLTGLTLIYVGFHLARGASGAAHRLVAELPARRPDLERGVVNLMETMSAYVIWGVYAIAALWMAGASFTSLAVVAGGLSVGVGFGLQNIINNFISGLILLFGRSVQAGDILQVGDIWGTVQRVNIRNTVVQTFDNATLFVPNSDLIAQKIMNWSHKDRRVRRILEVGVAYGSDTAKVQQLLLEAASSHPRVLPEPGPVAQFIAFGDSSLNFKLLFWVDDIDNGPRTSSDVHMAVDRLFKENGIEIPFPQRDVNLRGQAAAPVQNPFDSNGEEGRNT